MNTPQMKQDINIPAGKHSLATAIHNHLKFLGLETPYGGELNEHGLPSYNKSFLHQEVMAAYQKIILAMGLDPAADGMIRTPERIADLFTKDLFIGLSYENFPQMSLLNMNEDSPDFLPDQMITLYDIEFRSTCEHHFALIEGQAIVKYIPSKHILGFSRIMEIVSFFARRPQIQERLTGQIYHTLDYMLKPKYLEVSITGTHHCTSKSPCNHNSHPAKVETTLSTPQEA